MRSSPLTGAEVPLCDDLDGTLVRTDVLVESINVLLKRNPLYAFLLPIWLLKGRAYYKQRIAVLVDLEVSSFPYHHNSMDFLRAQLREGRRLVLVTASNGKVARQMVANLAIFNDAFASDESQNLYGERKRDHLR